MKKFNRIVPDTLRGICFLTLLYGIALYALDGDWIGTLSGVCLGFIMLIDNHLFRVIDRQRARIANLLSENIAAINDLADAERKCATLTEDNTALRVRIDTLTRINADAVKHRDRVEREFVKVCKENRHLEAEIKRLRGEAPGAE